MTREEFVAAALAAMEKAGVVGGEADASVPQLGNRPALTVRDEKTGRIFCVTPAAFEGLTADLVERMVTVLLFGIRGGQNGEPERLLAEWAREERVLN